jgi:hypothetical protein
MLSRLEIYAQGMVLINFNIIPSLHTVSYAADRSKNTNPVFSWQCAGSEPSLPGFGIAITLARLNNFGSLVDDRTPFFRSFTTTSSRLGLTDFRADSSSLMLKFAETAGSSVVSVFFNEHDSCP